MKPLGQSAVQTVREARLLLFLGVVLAALTLGLYWPVHRHGFVDFDDPEYIVSNAHVCAGLAWDSVRWAFTTAHMSNWHPLTWISHMVDCEWFGLDPAGHHLVNLLIHALTAALLLLALHRLTGAVWRSAVVAALFALHPLRVESVAWVAERKDVLSGCFFMATLYAYARYVERPSRARYLLALAAFTCGLLSKSMLVTLPFALLLLDFWPLNRWQPETPLWPALRRLLREKAPFFALAFAISLVTFLTQSQGKAVAHVAVLPLFPRVANALVSYLRYLRKMVWPDDLAVFYPYQGWALWQTVSAAVVLVGISVLVIRWARRYPWLFTGWFWYLGMLVPVIGLVQVGHQAMADRYSYLPSVGITVLMVWQVAETLGRLRRGGAILTLMGAGAIAGCMVATSRLLPVWQNTFTLFSHAAEVTRNNELAHFKIGFALEKMGRNAEAVPHYLRCLEISPVQEEAHYNLGIWFAKQGDWDRADFHFGKALALDSERVDTYGQLGAIRLRQGQVDAAINLFLQAVKVDPRSKVAHHNLGAVLSDLGRGPEAVQHFSASLAIEPGAFDSRVGLAFALARMGRFEEAERHLRKALALRPDSSEALKGLGIVLSAEGRFEEAQRHLEESLRQNSNDAGTHLELGAIQLRQNQFTNATQHLRTAVSLDPQQPRALERLAWVLATAPDPQLRNGPEAVRLAERAAQLTQEQIVEPLDTLAAAYAEAGRFPDAAATGEKALRLARDRGRTAQVAEIANRLELYRSGKPLRGESP